MHKITRNAYHKQYVAIFKLHFLHLNEFEILSLNAFQVEFFFEVNCSQVGLVLGTFILLKA